MTPKQITQAAILYQLVLYKRFNGKQSGALGLVHRMAKVADSYELPQVERVLLAKVWADNRFEAQALERYWRL